MFKFLRLFSITTLLSLSLAAAALAWLYRESTLNDLVVASEQASSTHAKVFANALSAELGTEGWQFVRDEAPGLNAEQLQAHPMTQRIDKLLRRLATGTNVVQLNLLSLSGTTLYSTETGQIGRPQVHDPEFQHAARGVPRSHLLHRASFMAVDGQIFDRDLVSTHAPVTLPGERLVVAVFQLYADQSAMKASIDDALVYQLAALIGVITVLFGLQFAVVRKGARVIERQERGLQAALEELALARHRMAGASASHSDFLANISQEIRTPMNGILGMAEALALTPLDSKQGRCAQTILSSGRALLAMLNDMLDLSRFEAGSVDLNVRAFNLKESVKSACALMSASAADKGLELKCDLSYDLPASVLGDNLRLQQVLLILIDNAIKFTDKGSIQVSVQPAREEHAYRIAVRDTGVGLSPDARERLFTPFMQAPGKGDARAPGSVLGLSMARNLVELMGGRIDVSSSPGRGSEFFIHLRLPPPEVGLATKAKPGLKSSAAGSARKNSLSLQTQGL